MRKAAFVLGLFVCSVPLFAARHHWKAAPVSSPLVVERVTDPDLTERLVRQATVLRARNRAGIGTMAIANNTSTRTFIIPAAGSVRGNGGTFFRSDVTLVNWNQTPQTTAILWYGNGASAPTVFKTTLPGDRPPFTTTDFVGTVLGLQGLGSMLFFPTDAAGNFDENGAIDGFSRIWTNQPNATGTVSQPFPGVDVTHMMGEYEGFILGLRQDSAYRTNFGVVNMSDRPLPFLITVFPESAPPGTTLTEVRLTVPAQGMVQQALPGNANGPINLLVDIDADQPDSDFIWTAYASSTDNITGDGWVSIVGKPYDDDSLDTAGLRRGSK